MLTVGSLFSGIGGLELGLERAGLGPVLWQVEIDPFCRRVLEKHWPKVKRYEDVRYLVPGAFKKVDIICGGFPCQDVSTARPGHAAGLGGARSGLWCKFAGIIEEVRPRFAVIENVAHGRRAWLPSVRKDLHVLGYRTRAFQVPAAAAGAPHRRDRIYVVAHTDREPLRLESEWGSSRRAQAVRRQRQAELVGHGGARVAAEPSFWPAQPALHRVDDGFPGPLDARRIAALGNAAVPQCAEAIGRVILQLAGLEAA